MPLEEARAVAHSSSGDTFLDIGFGYLLRKQLSANWRELRHSPEKVWQALTDPAHLREWAPFVTDENMGTIGTAKLTWAGEPTPIETKVTRANAPKVLEYGDDRWELEPLGDGTRLTLWSNIDRRFIRMGRRRMAHCFRCSGSGSERNSHRPNRRPEAMKFNGWQRMVAEYALWRSPQSIHHRIACQGA